MIEVFQFSGIKNGNECYCFGSDPNEIHENFDELNEKLWYVEENSNCNMKCKVGEAEYLCGGQDSMSLYVASRSK